MCRNERFLIDFLAAVQAAQVVGQDDFKRADAGRRVVVGLAHGYFPSTPTANADGGSLCLVSKPARSGRRFHARSRSRPARPPLVNHRQAGRWALETPNVTKYLELMRFFLETR